MAYFPTTPDGVISTVNSSTSTLAISGVFTGTSEEVTAYSSITIYVYTNVASATDGLSIQQSNDGTNWDVIDVYTVPAMTAGQGKTYGVQATARYFRLVYTNGGTIQGTFRLQTVYHKYAERTSSVRPQDARSNDNDFSEVIAYNAIFNGTTWDRTRGDTTNGMDVDVTRLPALVAGTAQIGTVGLQPQTTGGLTTYHLVSAGTTNATNIKNTPGQVFGWYIYNSNAAARKVVFHNTAGTPTAGASVFFSLMIPPTSGANVEMTNGIAFSAGIAITTVTGLADSDTAAVALNDLIINVFYK